MNLLEALWREHGMTLILVSHDSAVVRRAQRIGVMSKAASPSVRTAGPYDRVAKYSCLVRIPLTADHSWCIRVFLS